MTARLSRFRPIGGLTVSEVIERLRTLDPDRIVVIEGRYGGLASVKATVPVDIVLNVNRDPDFGPHDRADKDAPADAKGVALVCHAVLEAE